MTEENAENLDEFDQLAKELSESTEEQEESAPPVEETETTEQESETEEEPLEEPEKKPEPDGFQKRINKRTRDYYNEKEKREAAEAEIAKLRQQIKPVQKPEPTLADDGIDYDEPTYQRELAKYYAEQAIDELESKRSYDSELNEINQIIDKHQERIDVFAKDDYYDVIEPLIKNKVLSGNVSEAIMLDDKSAEITYHLGKNPTLAAEIGKMPEKKAYAEIGKLSVKLSQVKKKPTTKAPDPVKTAGSGGSHSKSFTDPDADYSMEELDAMLYK